MGRLITCAGCGLAMEMGEGARWEGPRPVGMTVAGSRVCLGCLNRLSRRMELERTEAAGRALLYVRRVLTVDLPEYEVGEQEAAAVGAGPCGIWSRSVAWGLYADASALPAWLEFTRMCGVRWTLRQPATVQETGADLALVRRLLMRPFLRPDYEWPGKRRTTVDDGLLAFHQGQLWAKDFEITEA